MTASINVIRGRFCYNNRMQIEGKTQKKQGGNAVSALKSAYKIPPPKSTLDVLTDHLAQQGSLNIPGQ